MNAIKLIEIFVEWHLFGRLNKFKHRREIIQKLK